MSYGWAILVVMIIMSALYFFGVFSPKTTNTCNIKAPFNCNDIVATQDQVTFSLGATNVGTATVENIKINGQDCESITVNGQQTNVISSPNNLNQISCVGLELSNKIKAEIEITYALKRGLSHTIIGSGSGIVEGIVEQGEGQQNQIPTATITSPQGNLDINVGENVNFEGSGTDNDGSIQAYEWTLDGNSISDQPTFTYTFDNAGQYNIILRVQDNENAWSTNNPARVINVQQQQNQPPTIQLNSPTNNAQNQPISLALSWTGNDPEENQLYYDVYLDNNPVGTCQDITAQTCDLTNLNYETQYSWYIIVTDNTNDPVQSETRTFTTQAQQQQEGLLEGLIALWHFEGDAADSSGLNNHGTPQNGADCNSQEHKFGEKSCYLDGTNDYINVNNVNDNINGAQGTISLWLRRTFQNGGGSNKNIIYFRESGNNYIDLFYSTGISWWIFDYSAGGTNKRITINANIIPINTWKHVTITWDKNAGATGEFKLYVNGVQQGIQTGLGTWNGNINYGDIGRRGYGTPYYLHGYFDEVAIWNRALTPDEISTIYQNQIPNP